MNQGSAYLVVVDGKHVVGLCWADPLYLNFSYCDGDERLVTVDPEDVVIIKELT